MQTFLILVIITSCLLSFLFVPVNNFFYLKLNHSKKMFTNSMYGEFNNHCYLLGGEFHDLHLAAEKAPSPVFTDLLFFLKVLPWSCISQCCERL